MKQPRKMLAIDLGASNGRIVYGVLDDSGIQLRELHRFPNIPVRMNGILYWDVQRIWAEICQGLTICGQEGLTPESIGLCSWGNTIALLDSSGDLMTQPVHYRDECAQVGYRQLCSKKEPQEMFQKTWFLPMSIQPAGVLNWLSTRRPGLLEYTDTVLLISDFFNQLLCGTRAAERTMAATSQLMNLEKSCWDEEYMHQLGLNPAWFAPIVCDGEVLGTLDASVARQAGLERPPVVCAVAGHDTASAAACIPSSEIEESLYLSCGTWSCMGCRIPELVKDIRVQEFGATNDVGVWGQKHMRFNHTGLWILQECRREWKEQGILPDYEEFDREISEAPEFLASIDTEDESFFYAGDMPSKVKEYCRKTGQHAPSTPAETARVILESLAFRYRYSADVLSELTGIEFRRLNLIGGGSKDPNLCSFTSAALGIPVFAGPSEASVLGNLIQQAEAAGWIVQGQEGEWMGKIIRQERYLPEDSQRWDAEYHRAMKTHSWKPYGRDTK